MHILQHSLIIVPQCQVIPRDNQVPGRHSRMPHIMPQRCNNASVDLHYRNDIPKSRLVDEVQERVSYVSGMLGVMVRVV